MIEHMPIKKLTLTICLLSSVALAAQSVRYTGKVDFAKELPFYDGIESFPDPVFSGDFSKDIFFDKEGKNLFIVWFSLDGNLRKYKLSSPYSIETAVLSDINEFKISNGSTFWLGTTGLHFTDDGTYLFISYLHGPIRKYKLSNPYDISSFNVEDEIDLSSDESRIQDFTFSPDGTKLFIIGDGDVEINQYQLNNPFELSSGFSWVGSFDVSNEETNPMDLRFDSSGKKLFITGTNSNAIHQYTLSIPFDITSGLSEAVVSFSLFGIADGGHGLALSNNLSELFVLNTNRGSVIQLLTARDYGEVNVFLEDEQIDDGSLLEKSMIVSLVDEIFFDPGVILFEGEEGFGDFEIHNLPEGLFAEIEIDESGTFGQLTIDGNANHHLDANDVDTLKFTFFDHVFERGDASLINGAVNAPSSFSIDFYGEDPLPVELSNFYGKKEENKISLHWVTVSEQNNDYFEVQRSSTGMQDSFKSIATINGAGNNNSVLDYFYIDDNPSLGDNYYRLKQVDFDGAFEYSETIYQKCCSEPNLNEIKVYPNTASLGKGFYLKLDANIGEFKVKGFGLNGTEMKVELFDLNNGLYLVKLVNSSVNVMVLEVLMGKSRKKIVSMNH